MKRYLVILLVIAGLAAVGLAGDPPARFPRPDFESGYAPPATQCPAPRPGILLWVDVGVLAGSMGLASWLVLKRRSRGGLIGLLLFCLAYFGFYRKGCVCPVGSLQNMALALSDLGYAVPWAVVALFVLPLVFALFCGRVFCAAVCPLGAIQDVVIRRPVLVPAWLAGLLSFLPVYLLGSSVLLAAGGAGFMICAHDPFVGFFRLGASVPMLVAGGLMLAAGVWVARPYCRFFCAYGVILGWLSRLSARHARITPDSCVACRLCERACPFDCIRAPTPVADPEERGVTRRRFRWMIAALPMIVAAGVWFGLVLAPLLAGQHPVVRLANRLAREERGMVSGLTLESEAFRMSGQSLAEVKVHADAMREWFRRGAMIFGGFLGLVFALRMIGLSRVRSRTEYTIDTAACFSCGRCFSCCPVDKAWREGRNTSELKV